MCSAGPLGHTKPPRDTGTVPGCTGGDTKAEHDQCSLLSCRSWAPDPKTASPVWDVTPKWGTPAPSLALPRPGSGSGPSTARRSLLLSAVDFEGSKMFVLSTRA